MKRTLLFASLALSAPALLQAQMPKWCNPPVLFDWATHSQTATIATSPSDPDLYGSNGLYDQNGNLAQYTFGPWAYGQSPYIAFSPLNSLDTRECNFIKVPGTCMDQYVIYATCKAVGTTAYVRYTMQHWLPGNSQWIDDNVQRYLDLTQVSASGWCNLAISKQLANKNRYLFISGSNGLGKYLISNTDISFVSMVTTSTASAFRGEEGELYETGSGYKYATGGYASAGEEKIGVINMDANGNFVSQQSYSGVGKVHGLEFIDADRILFSSTAGVGVLNLSSGAISYFSNTTNCRNAHIEKAADGKFYTLGKPGVDWKLVELNPAILTATFTSYTYNSIEKSPADANVHCLVDQVDNEDYLAVTRRESRADLVIKDEPLDMGVEPTVMGLYTAEGDVWNCHGSGAGSCSSNQNPRSAQTEYMNVRVYNYGCATSQPAELHMYWTRARSGEIWLDHWHDPSIAPGNEINGHPAGGEITVQPGTTLPAPIMVPSLAPGQSMVFSQEWEAPDRAWYPIDPNHDDGSNPMVCFLARVYSTQDPMTLETPVTVINTNVVRNNNIATRNSFLVSFPRPGGRPSPWVIQDGSFMINNPTFETRVIDRIRLTGLTFGRNIGSIRSLQLELDPNLYQRWQAGGAQGTGIVDAGSNRVLITDNKLAELTNLNIQPGEEFTLVPVIEFDANAGLKGQVDIYKFMINHVYPDGTTMSPGVYYVQFDDNGVANKSSQEVGTVATAGHVPLLSPNPTTGVLHIQYNNLAEDAVIVLYDHIGRKVQSNALTGANSTISISRLPAGLYFYQITSGKDVFKGKITKE